ncbi:MAG: VWA domain-containing protein [Cellvibrionales bacterium]|nr:VWA domain-containing protein [Cellvibrionales bacterium]
MRRRQASTFNLSFLDIMSCGLGAAVLLFLLIKHSSEVHTGSAASSETRLLATEIRIGQENLARIRNSLSAADAALARAQGLARQIQEQIDALRGQITALGPQKNEQIEQLERQIAQLEQQKQALQKRGGGNRVRATLGQGERQYLTGLHMGGRRALILLDSSASMLDKTIVNIIRRRNRPDAVKQAAPKWQQALAMVDWLAANLSPDSRFQIYTFAETAQAAADSQAGQWLAASAPEDLEQALQALRQRVPAGGTNLLAAVQVIRELRPLPDNVFLITDGLPTQGEKKPKGNTVSGRQRIGFFNEAMRALPKEIPVNTLLLPMEGDPLAAAAFWRIALETRGSFIAPSEDWP